MHVLALRFDLVIPGCGSLKEKRAVLRSLIDGIRHRYRLSVSEVADHDVWQRATIGVAIVGHEIGHIQSVADEVDRFVWSTADAEVAASERYWLDAD